MNSNPLEYEKLSQSLKDRNLIDIGDKVGVYISDYVQFIAIVKYKAGQTGECWIFEDMDGNIHYVQNFFQITKYKEITKNKEELPF